MCIHCVFSFNLTQLSDNAMTRAPLSFTLLVMMTVLSSSLMVTGQVLQVSKSRVTTLDTRPVTVKLLSGQVYKKQPYQIVGDRLLVSGDTLSLTDIEWIKARAQRRPFPKIAGYTLLTVGSFYGAAGLLSIPATFDDRGFIDISPWVPVVAIAGGVATAYAGHTLAGARRKYNQQNGWRLSIKSEQ